MKLYAYMFITQHLPSITCIESYGTRDKAPWPVILQKKMNTTWQFIALILLGTTAPANPQSYNTTLIFGAWALHAPSPFPFLFQSCTPWKMVLSC